MDLVRDANRLGTFHVVLDTNVLISALITNGKAHLLLKKIVARQECTLLLSNDILREVAGVLSRPKFHLEEIKIGSTVDWLVFHGNVMMPKSKFKVVTDPDDDMILNLAYDGKADYVVSGDSDLLDMGKFKDIRIITINEMLEILQDRSTP